MRLGRRGVGEELFIIRTDSIQIVILFIFSFSCAARELFFNLLTVL